MNSALAQQSTIEGELSHAQMLEIAQELSIAPDSIERAQCQWLDRQKLAQKHQQFDTYRRSKLQERLGKYAIVNVCLVPLNLLTGFGVPWSLYVLISWGAVRGVDAWRDLSPRQLRQRLRQRVSRSVMPKARLRQREASACAETLRVGVAEPLAIRRVSRRFSGCAPAFVSRPWRRTKQRDKTLPLRKVGARVDLHIIKSSFLT